MAAVSGPGRPLPASPRAAVCILVALACAVAEPQAAFEPRGGRALASSLGQRHFRPQRRLQEQEPSDAVGCNAECVFEGSSALCGKRVEWAQTHMFSEYRNSCKMARDLVATQCDICTDCTLEELGCGSDEDVAEEDDEEFELEPTEAPLDEIEDEIEDEAKLEEDREFDDLPADVDPVGSDESAEEGQSEEDEDDPARLDDDDFEDGGQEAAVTDTAITEINWQNFGGEDEEDEDEDEYHEEETKEEEDEDEEEELEDDNNEFRVLVPEETTITTTTRTRTATITTKTWTRTATTTHTASVTISSTTSSTKTHTLKPAPTVYSATDLSVDEKLGCDSMCVYMDRFSTCTDRVLWSATREFAGEPHACDLSHGLVLEQCPVCSLCLLHKTGCHQSKTPSTGLPYECNLGLATWQDSWDAAKVEWCCKNHGLGCSSDDVVPDSNFKCAGNTKSWTAVQARWCCAHKGVGCSVKKYPCKTDGRDWESWSSDQKVWCYNHTDFATLHSCPVHDKLWKRKWRDSKKAWCCQYDTTWADSKKDWCCQREGVGCDRLYKNELTMKLLVGRDSTPSFMDGLRIDMKTFLWLTATGLAVVLLVPTAVKLKTRLACQTVCVDGSRCVDTREAVYKTGAPAEHISLPSPTGWAVRPESISLLAHEPPVLPDPNGPFGYTSVCSPKAPGSRGAPALETTGRGARRAGYSAISAQQVPRTGINVEVRETPGPDGEWPQL